MNRLLVACLFVILTIGPPASATTTSQIWYFNTPDPAPPPDFVDNPNGDPILLISVTPESTWLPPGIWAMCGEIDVIIHSGPVSDEVRIIIELIWAPGQTPSCFLPLRPLFGVQADGMMAMEMEISEEPLVDDWIFTTCEVSIWPNPLEEWVAIKGNILVDQLEIRTQAIPEPATLLLLTLGSLVALRGRKAR